MCARKLGVPFRGSLFGGRGSTGDGYVRGRAVRPPLSCGWQVVARGLTLVELLVVIGMIALLVAILLPSLSKVRQMGWKTVCVNNLRQWGVATMYYREEWEDFLPAEGSIGGPVADGQTLSANVRNVSAWFNSLPPYLGAPSYMDVDREGKLIKEFPALNVWICPAKNSDLGAYKSVSGQNQFHYGMNLVLDGFGEAPDSPFPDREPWQPIQGRLFQKEPHTVYMFDIAWNSPCGQQPQVGTRFHGDAANVLYLDTGVGTFRARDFVIDGDFEARHVLSIWDHPQLYWGWRPPPRWRGPVSPFPPRPPTGPSAARPRSSGSPDVA